MELSCGFIILKPILGFQSCAIINHSINRQHKMVELRFCGKHEDMSLICLPFLPVGFLYLFRGVAQGDRVRINEIVN